MNLRDIKYALLHIIPDGIQWTALRTKHGRFELHHYGSQVIIGQALCKFVAGFTAVGYDVFFDVEQARSTDGASDQLAHVVSYLIPRAVEARTPKKPERRGEKPDRRQSKRRISDKAKARLSK